LLGIPTLIQQRGSDVLENNARGANVRVAFRILGAIVFAVSPTLFWRAADAADGGFDPSEAVWPMPQWRRAEPAAVGMDEAALTKARDYALTGGGSGYITRHGRLVMAWGDPRARYDLKSTTKSFGSLALGLAIKDGKLRLEEKAKRLHPTLGVPPEENARTGWLDEITILHLASQTAGFEKPGGYTKLLFRPGTQWDYSDSGPNWLAECITLAYGRDLDEWMFERVFTPLGIQRSDLTWRKNSYRPATIEGVARREFGAGIHANVDAMARIGYLMLREGQWNGREILTRQYARLAVHGVRRRQRIRAAVEGEAEYGTMSDPGRSAEVHRREPACFVAGNQRRWGQWQESQRHVDGRRRAIPVGPQRRQLATGLDQRRHPAWRGVCQSRPLLPVRRQLQRGPEALPVGANGLGRGHSLCRWVGDL